jgi:5'-nucleotidase
MRTPRVLLTNDDGIDAPGIGRLYEELRSVADVTVVAPAENQSGMGRLRNGSVRIVDHPMGYELDGTPADCVAFGLGGGVDGGFDLVVAGINDGPNLGNYVMGRSGTVGAGMEAAFLGVPAVAVSAYHSEDFHCSPPDEYDFSRPAAVARRLIERTAGSNLFDEVDLLNVNAPVDVAASGARLTRLLADYGQRVEANPGEGTGDGEDDEAARAGEPADGRRVRLVDQTWPHVDGFENPFPGLDAHRDRYPDDSDRRAVIDGAVSISPLSLAHEYVASPELAELVDSLQVS